MIRPMSARGRRWLGLAGGALFALLLAVPTSVAAQGNGTVVGTVTDAQSNRPLESVQVFIDGTGIGALTNASGRYLLLNVPAGTHIVSARLVGYREASSSVTVSAGDRAVADFALAQTAIELNEIVVTGAGVATEKRKLGNTIASIDVSNLQDAPVTSFSELVSGREAGLVGLPSSGTTGEGARIRIRGSASLSQSNEPIIYVDGIRVDRAGGFANVGAGGQGSPSRLDDIPPDAIERIEILKGAAAATLYGTEASNGVIQIFTKRGTQGAPRWSFQMDQTAITTPTNRMIPIADFPRDATQASAMSSMFNTSVQPYDVLEVEILPELFTTGWNQTYSGSVSGGADLITYFVSARFAYEDGPFDAATARSALNEAGFDGAQDTNRKVQTTANLNIFPTDNLAIKFSSLYSTTDHKTPDNSNNIYGVFSSALMSQLRLATADNIYGQPAFATFTENLNQYVQDESQHFASSLSANLKLNDEITVDGTFGIDLVNQRSSDFRPFGWGINDFTTSQSDGSRGIGSRQNREITADFKGSWVTNFGDDFESTFLAGVQGFLSQNELSGGRGTAFPGPGIEVASAGGQQSLVETWLRNTQVGGYLQEQFGLYDHTFITVGGRWDANSAFGESFETAFYPKLSVSFIPTDAFGWESETFSTFRLRGAIGKSGLQPGAFDKFTTFSPIVSTSGPGLQPSNLGNQELRPEVATEIELGTEIGLFNDRIGVDFTYWDRTVEDAMVSRQFPVSGGFSAEQLDNIGQIEASGIELAVNGSVINGENFSLNMFANVAYIDELVSDMGGAPPLKTGGSYPRYRNFIKEGYAPGAFFGSKIADMNIPLDIGATACVEPTQAEAEAFFAAPVGLSDFEVIPINCANGSTNAEGTGFLDTYLGKPTPDYAGSLGFNMSFLGNFEISSLFEYKFGNFQVQDLSGMFRQANAVIGRNTPAAARVGSILANPASTPQQRIDAAVEWATTLRALAPMSGMNGIHDADFMRWRELSLTYRVPSETVERIGASSLTLNLGARNLALWMNDAYTGMDPEVNILGRCNGGLNCNFLTSVEGWGIPIPRRLTFSARVGF
ncbi:MAG: SusC/RagA family TonB-linked outer membrane protein [Rhodothermales bacterium]|nr:SusC/RagA family TonB-linked outer membrane protein [Rhodothermales bacterium]